MDCTNKMTIFSLKKLSNATFLGENCIFFWFICYLKIIQRCFCFFIMFLHTKMTLLAFKTKNHFTMNNDLFKHFNGNI
jgi:hypothetical protein